MNTKILISHPTANVFSLALAKHLISVDKLESFRTSIAWSSENPLLRRLPSSLRSQLNRRAVDPSFHPFLKTNPLPEIGRLATIALKWKALHGKETSLFSIDAIYRHIDQWVAKGAAALDPATILYAYEDGAYHTFQEGRRKGLTCVYDLPIAYWSLRKQLFAEEMDRYPEWAPTMRGMDDSQAKLDRKTEEAKLADMIICPSDFVKRSIPSEVADPAKIAVVPFGSPTISTSQGAYRINDISKPLSVLFVASMSQRKGLADLFSAIRLMPKGSVTLHIIGAPILPLEFYQKWGPEFEYLGTMPREQVLNHMRESDVMVLPSIAEGRALVTQEALSQGLPIIITPNTGAEDLIDPGQNGFLVPVRNPEAIADKLTWFCEHRKEIESMKSNAQNSVRAFTWESYAVGILEFIESYVGQHTSPKLKS